MHFEIRFTNGQLEYFETLEKAERRARRLNPKGVVGHANDLRDGGTRTFFWFRKRDFPKTACAAGQIVEV